MVIGIDPSLTCTGISDGKRHVLIKTKPGDGTTAYNNLRRVNEIILDIIRFVAPVDEDNPPNVWIEGPMLNAQGASHLYDVGWLYSELYRTAAKVSIEIREVQPTTLKKFITGNGQSKKKHKDGCSPEKLCVVHGAEAKWGITFDHDPGMDKLHAFALFKYGEAVANGEIEYNAPLRRGLKQKLRKKGKTKAADGKRGRGTSTRKQVSKARSTARQ